MKQEQLQSDELKKLANGDISDQLVLVIADAADDRKAEDILLLKVGDVCYLTEYMVIATGFSRTQVRAISIAIKEKVAEIFNRVPRETEGLGEANWVLQDYGDVIVHIFLPEEREYYNLEAFWGHAQRIEFSKILNQR